MDKQELIDFIRKNLSLKIDESLPTWGTSQEFTLELTLCGEPISGVNIVYNRESGSNSLDIYTKQY